MFKLLLILCTVSPNKIVCSADYVDKNYPSVVECNQQGASAQMVVESSADNLLLLYTCKAEA